MLFCKFRSLFRYVLSVSIVCRCYCVNNGDCGFRAVFVEILRVQIVFVLLHAFKEAIDPFLAQANQSNSWECLDSLRESMKDRTNQVRGRIRERVGRLPRFVEDDLDFLRRANSWKSAFSFMVEPKIYASCGRKR
jgi:hypothetical protein